MVVFEMSWRGKLIQPKVSPRANAQMQNKAELKGHVNFKMPFQGNNNVFIKLPKTMMAWTEINMAFSHKELVVNNSIRIKPGAYESSY